MIVRKKTVEYEARQFSDKTSEELMSWGVSHPNPHGLLEDKEGLLEHFRGQRK